MQNIIIFKAQSEAQYKNILAKLKAKGYDLSFSQAKLNNLAKYYKCVYMAISKQGKWVLYDNESDIIKVHQYYYNKLMKAERIFVPNEQLLLEMLK